MDSSSQSSSLSSHHYAALLHTVSELRSDLERTTARIKALEEQNLNLSSNYSIVKEELVDTRKKYNEARESYLKAVAEKFDAEREHETFIERLKVQLTEKTKEFEQIRDRLVPHDIDQLRIKVEEELQIQHKQELKVLEKEIDAQKDKFFGLKREYERSRVEYANTFRLLQQENVSLRSEKENLEESYRRESNSMISTDVSPVKEEKIRNLTGKVNELSHLIELLRDETKTMRQERDNAVFTLEQTRAKYDQTTNILKTKLATADAESHSLQERITRMANDVEKKEAIARNAKATTEDITDRLDQAVKEQQESERQLIACKLEHANQLELLRDTNHQEIRELQDEIDMIHNRLGERDDAIRRVQREASEMQIRAENSDAELRRAHQSFLQEIRKKYSAVELELAETKQSYRILEDQLNVLHEQHSLEKETLASELGRVKREKDVLHSKLREQDANIEGHRKKYSALQHEQFNKIALLEKQLRDAKAQLSSMEVRFEATHAKYTDAENDRHGLRDSYNNLERSYNELQVHHESLKNEFEHQLESLAPAFKEKADELKRKLKSALTKEKKRAEAYKAKALDAHAKMKALSDSPPKDY